MKARSSAYAIPWLGDCRGVDESVAGHRCGEALKCEGTAFGTEGVCLSADMSETHHRSVKAFNTWATLLCTWVIVVLL